ncbi:MAG TPA: serine/threonine-protein kinase [Gemmataceae bacterium]|nr:serine/threonine-protein kinase [Gemmataceae bacterium]
MSPAADQPDAQPEDDPRLVRAVQDYLKELEAGRRPDRHALATRFPDLAAAMAPYLDALDAVHAAAPLQNKSASSPPSPFEPERGRGEPAEPLGDFRIVREIGRGGMGVVYEAVQLSLGRRVALKVLPFAAALDARHLQRFKNEAQAAATLHHPNIVPVYFVGHERGVHFYAMQLIEGQNLAAVVEDLRHRERPESPRPGPDSTGPYSPEAVPGAPPAADTRTGLGAQLSTYRSGRATDFYRTVARLVAQAAEGLDYAHGLGVVHRDVKPANLLVDGRGNVWVTDFGLAQFHADPGLTQSGDLIGTLRYMSPEQAGGQRVLIDHRTDVYALGATLYELLTLRPIFDGADRQALLRQILHDEPAAPRAIDRSVPPELETIVLKAVSKAPAERYAMAREFADDLHRFLRDEPILARRETAAQRARKWLRRHPSVPVAAAVLLVLLTAGSLAGAWVIRGEQKKTEHALGAERERNQQAEQRFQLAQRAVDDMIQMASQEMADKPFLEDLRIRMLESALAYYQELIEQRGDDPDAQARLAVTRERVQKILADLVVLQGAGDLFLLNNAVVLRDLRLSDDQKSRLDDLLSRLGRQREITFKEFSKQTEAQRREKFLEQAHAGDTGMREVLTREQVRRFKQIALQAQGLRAFQDAKVSADLKLTPAQKEKIRAIEGDTFFGGFGGPRGRGGPPGGRGHGGGPGRKGRGGPPDGDRRTDYEQKMRKANDDILALLTGEQMKRWHEMTGDPVEGLTPGCPPGPQGPPPQFGRPGPPH